MYVHIYKADPKYRAFRYCVDFKGFQSGFWTDKTWSNYRMTLTLEPNRVYCVYEHYVGNLLICREAGLTSRAFDVNNRSSRWRDQVGHNPVRVVILKQCATREEATHRLQVMEGVTTSRARISRRLVGGRLTAIQCVETEQVWPSLREAGAFMGVSHSAIANAVSGRSPYVKGVRFQRIFVEE